MTQSQNRHRTDLEKLSVLLPCWVNHNNDHIQDQEKWLKKAEKERLLEVAAKLKKTIGHSKKANRYIEQAGCRIKDESVSKRSQITESGESADPSGENGPVQVVENVNLKPI